MVSPSPPKTVSEVVVMGGEKPREACGIFGAYLPGHQAARNAYFGILSLQHRGQESAGIAFSNGILIDSQTGMGLVAQVFREDDIDNMDGHIAISHTRYSTTGSSRIQNAQPLIAKGERGTLAMGHNGNVINAPELRIFCADAYGSEFSGTSDSEVIAELFAKTPGDDWFEVSDVIMSQLQGAYSLVMMANNALIGVRDPLGLRPLCLGRLNGGWILSSETSALATVGAELERELVPGEVVIIDENGVDSKVWTGAQAVHKMCIFEQIYFARPDSKLQGRLAYSSRKRMGAIAYKENPVAVDLVTGIPDSSAPHALGFSEAAGVRCETVFVKNQYVGRTFIQPDQRMRETGVRMKLNVMREIVEGQRIAVVDDSVVRSTTIRQVVSMLRAANAAEIHVRVAAPPIKSTCPFGVDMATFDELIAANYEVDEIRDIIGADSLRFLSLNGLIEAVQAGEDEYCRGCFTGKYPIEVQLEMDKLRMDKLTAASNGSATVPIEPEPVSAFSR